MLLQESFKFNFDFAEQINETRRFRYDPIDDSNTNSLKKMSNNGSSYIRKAKELNHDGRNNQNGLTNEKFFPLPYIQGISHINLALTSRAKINPSKKISLPNLLVANVVHT
jgi:hypothetical protein